MKTFFARLRDSRGATAIEYGLIAALIGIGSIAAMSRLGSKLGTQFNNVGNKLNVS